MKSVTLADAARDLSSLVSAACAGETIVITQEGVAVANLVPAPAALPDVDWEAHMDRLEREGVITRGRGKTPDLKALAARLLNVPATGGLDAMFDERESGW